MRKIEFPLGKKKEIIAMYSDKDIPVSEILETYHISQMLNSIAVQYVIKVSWLKTLGFVVGVDPMSEAKAISFLINSVSFGLMFIRVLIMKQRRKQKKYLMT